MEFEDKLATEEKIQMILRQTNYEENEACSKLAEHRGDVIQVIRAYMGIPEKKAPPVKSVNQEIYRQLRHKLDDSMREYNRKQQEKIAKEIQDYQNQDYNE